MSIYHDVCFYMLLLLAAKCLLFGSDFSFFDWRKYGKEYWNWYWTRENFKSKNVEGNK